MTKENTGPLIGLRIRALREARKESLNGLADAIGVGRGTIWGLESGRVDSPNVDTVVRCAAHFGVRVEELINGPVEDGDRVFGIPFPTLDRDDRDAVLAVCTRLVDRTVTAADVISRA